MKRLALPKAAGRSVGHGLTLIELMVTLAIGIILLAIAVPQMRELIARKRVAGVANELASDLRYARAMVAERNQPVWMSFGATNAFSCYVIYTDGAGGTALCDCTQTNGPVCPAEAIDPRVELKTVYLPVQDGITLTVRPTDYEFLQPLGEPATIFDATRPAEAVIRSSLGGELRLTLSTPARASICSAAGHGADFPACNP